MNHQAVEERVRTIIARQFEVDIEAVTPTASLFKDLAQDSLDVIELVLFLEREFAIKIKDEDLEKLGLVGDLTKYIQDRTAARPDLS
jgi:acyl carrier protein